MKLEAWKAALQQSLVLVLRLSPPYHLAFTHSKAHLHQAPSMKTLLPEAKQRIKLLKAQQPDIVE